MCRLVIRFEDLQKIKIIWSIHVCAIVLGAVEIVGRTMTAVDLLVSVTVVFCHLAIYTTHPLPEYECSFTKYCQPSTSHWWKCRSKGYFQCPPGKKYHCAKDYDSPEDFKEGCATEKFCPEGEEPFLSFKKDGKQVNEPEVYCRTCAENERYNNKQNTSSAEYSECPDKKWNKCTEEEHKKLCKPEDSKEERFCRCDARKGFYPVNDLSNQKCSYKNYDCGQYRYYKKCGAEEELLLNYTCAAKCDNGFARLNEDNDDCEPLPSVTTRKVPLLSPSKTIDYGATAVPSIRTRETGEPMPLECDEECEEYHICDSGKCVCREVCPAVYDPVCGYHHESDSFNTFSSKCQLGRHYCQQRTFVFYANGECKQNKGKECYEECEEYQICDSGKCVCREVCPAVHDPVCGYHQESDTFKTFTSNCEFGRHYCQYRKFVLHDNGECKKDNEKVDPTLWIVLSIIMVGVLGCFVLALVYIIARKKKCRIMSSNQKVKESGKELGSINKKETVKNEGENQSLIVKLEETSSNKQGQKAQLSKTDNNVQDQDLATADNTSTKKDADVNIESAYVKEKPINDKEKNEGENQFLIVNLAETRRNEQGQKAQSSKTENNVQDQDPATADNISNKKDADVNIESAIGEEKKINDQVKKGAEGKPLLGSEDKSTNTNSVEVNRSNKEDNTGYQSCNKDNVDQVQSSDINDAEVGVMINIGEKKHTNEQVKKEGKDRSLFVSKGKFPAETRRNEQGQKTQPSETDNYVHDSDPVTVDNTADRNDADMDIELAIGEETQINDQDLKIQTEQSSDFYSLKNKRKQSVDGTPQHFNYGNSPDSCMKSDSPVDYSSITAETDTGVLSIRGHSISITESEEDHQISNSFHHVEQQPLRRGPSFAPPEPPEEVFE